MIYALIVCYIAFSVWLLFRIQDIKVHPKKYDMIPGYEGFERSGWYWTSKKPYCLYGSPSKSHIASSYMFVFFMVLFLLSLELFAYWSRPNLPRDSTTIRFFASSSSYGATCISLIAYSAVLAEYWIMFSKRPVAICSNLYNHFRKDTRSEAWRKMTTIVLLATIIVCPLHILCLANTGYADSEKIIYRTYGTLKDTVIYYDELDRVEKVYDEKGRERHCYLHGPNGEQIDINGLGEATRRDSSVERFVLSFISPEKLS